MPSEFRNRLRGAREQKRMSQGELANAVGLSQASVSQFEKGQRQPTPAIIRKLAKALDVSEEALAGQDKGDFEKAMLMRNINDLSPESHTKINDYVHVIRENERLRRRGKL